MVQVVFNYAAWKQSFPQFACLSEQQIMNTVLPFAVQYNVNNGGGPVCSSETQTALLNLMVAHVAQLLYGPDGQGAAGVVGRISSATEGSVSVSAEFPTTATNAWYLQTNFGAMWWAMTAPYRTMRYFPGPRRIFNPYLRQ